MKTMYVYILSCADGSYYTGATNNISKRYNDHCNGTLPQAYTFSRRPLELVYCQPFTDPETAITYEKKIKGWTRKKKKALIAENWEALKKLSVCKNITSHKNFKT